VPEAADGLAQRWWDTALVTADRARRRAVLMLAALAGAMLLAGVLPWLTGGESTIRFLALPLLLAGLMVLGVTLRVWAAAGRLPRPRRSSAAATAASAACRAAAPRPGSRRPPPPADLVPTASSTDCAFHGSDHCLLHATVAVGGRAR
jgi:hypothetical protein